MGTKENATPTKIEAALEGAVRRFIERNPTSQKLFNTAVESLPGGNTRTTLYAAPYSVSMRKGEGHRLYDEDGHEYVDLVGELTAGLFGHSNPVLQKALTNAIDEVGLSLGATTVHEQRYASLLCRRFSLDKIRFTNSGTEANIHALAAARRFTGRRRVVVYRGGYHGSVLSFANGVAPNNVDQGDWILVQYNDIAGTRAAFEKYNDIAAVLLEGMQGSGGAVQASYEFLQEIGTLTEKAGAVFILDEVMTSRLAPGGLKSLLNLQPDIVTFGKYLGGGMPFGAFGGKKEIMNVYDPRVANSLAHSGTFQNNTLMLIAGYTGLSEVYTPEIVGPFNERGNLLRERLQHVFKGSKICVTGRGSLMCIHATHTGMTPEEIKCKDDVAGVEAQELKQLIWLKLLKAGFWVHPRGSIALNLRLSQEALDSFVHAAEKFCDTHWDLIAM